MSTFWRGDRVSHAGRDAIVLDVLDAHSIHIVYVNDGTEAWTNAGELCPKCRRGLATKEASHDDDAA
jgi:hypothetical protein